LGRQFLLESFLLVGAAVVAAVVLAQVATPHFNRHFDMALSWQSLSWQEAWSWLAGLTLLVGLAAGFYPAALLSGFRPALALKQKTTLSGKTIQLRRWLTVTQFILSITLIISTIVVHEQLSFIREKDLGFKRENVVVIETYGTEIRREKLFAYREKLGQYPTVLGHTVADAAPGTTPDASIVNIAGRTDKPKLNVMYADFEFADALGLSVVAGRNFDAQFATDSTRAALINESACRTLGVTPAQAIGMELTPVYFDTIPQKVVGVLQDYHFLSLHEKIAPLIILTNYRYPGTLAVRVASGALQTTLATMQRDWEQLDPSHPFEYRLLDERLARLYETETQQGKLFGFFAAAAIFIACLGMFGLATLLAAQRTKEVGIRKVLGASVGSITALLTRDFLYLVLIALLVAIPVAYHLMQQWLADFAYRISLQGWMFAVAGLSAMAIALLTVGFQSIKAALANPVKSLRNE
jgi:putative ABC transport system permease protein